jgi:glutamate-1-semialdehyde 2,1-aminomutase
MGGGFPISAYGGRKEIMKMVAPAGGVYQAGTFSGNPVSVVAGLTALQYIRSKGRDFYDKLESRTETIVKALGDIVHERNRRFQISHISSMFQVFFTQNRVYDYRSAKTSNLALFKFYHRRLLERGIFIPPSQFETCFVSESHTKEDINQTIEAMTASMPRSDGSDGERE